MLFNKGRLLKCILKQRRFASGWLSLIKLHQPSCLLSAKSPRQHLHFSYETLHWLKNLSIKKNCMERWSALVIQASSVKHLNYKWCNGGCGSSVLTRLSSTNCNNSVNCQNFVNAELLSYRASFMLLPILSVIVVQSCLTLCNPRLTDVAHQAPLPMGFSWQKHWSGWPFPSPGDLPDPGIEPGSPAFQADSLPSEPPQKQKTTGGFWKKV